MGSCSNQKVSNKSKYILYLRFFIALMIALHTLGILLASFTWNAFPTVLKEFPHMLSTCWLIFLQSAVQLIPKHLNWVEVRVIVEARSSDAALHHSPSWSNSPYTAWRCVLGHCSVEQQMVVPLSANQMEWRIAAEC